ncbi:DUF3768 domain-containing protein [Pelagibius litoralis]|uniref:DUF3768 domain-containing protein n=1 Tax=Pelagibius litoralis TaxID=374515 RepID=A0A967KAJ0_9PROT|nr:DUF3768 domain-containing protein [Pelagibius litoralis]
MPKGLDRDCAERTSAFEGFGLSLTRSGYRNSNLSQQSPDPSDPARTKRVLTVMLAEEFDKATR